MATLVLRPDGGDAYWDRIDEEYPNEDTDYIFQGYTGGIKNFTLTDTSQTGTINSVRLDVRARAQNADYKPSIANRIVTHGTAYLGTNVQLTTSYVTRNTTWTTNPYTAAAWTWVEVNDLNAGWSRSSRSATGKWYSRVTWLQVVVDFVNPQPPTVSTLAANEIKATGANLNGSLTNTGTTPVDIWFQYGETVSYGFSSPHDVTSIATSFSHL